MKKLRVLVGCEFSGRVRDAFRAKGHDAWSCDLLPTDAPGPHIKGDVSKVIHDGWDIGIFHPPCTFITNSGVCHLQNDPARYTDMRIAALFFRSLLDAPINRIAVENPIPHKYAMRLIQIPYTQVIQPFMFGHSESKATCLWLKNLPHLVPTKNVWLHMRTLPKREQQRLHHLPPSKNRAKLRSLTYLGIAQAMAEQWGSKELETYTQQQLTLTSPQTSRRDS